MPTLQGPAVERLYARGALFLFVFQAEDGIRGLYVTGVQTCALPLCGGHRARPRCRPAPAIAGAAATRRGSWQRLSLDRQHGREITHDGRPAVAPVGGSVHLTARCAEIHTARLQ